MNNLYLQRFPDRDFHEHSLDILGLDSDQYDLLQGVSYSWLTGSEDFPSPKVKLKPSSLRTVSTVDQQTLAALMALEHSHHDDRTSDFHKGGGLYETGRHALQTIWELSPFSWLKRQLFDTVGISSSSARANLNADTYLDADIVSEAYSELRDSRLKDNQVEYKPSQSSEKMAVYLDPMEKIVYIGVRGTKMNTEDLLSDLKIMKGNKSGHEEEVAQELKDIISQYPDDWKFEVSGHSLGGLEVMNVFMGSPEDPQLGRVDEINLFNPGLSPIHNLDTAKAAAQDPRFNLFLNTGDMISNTMSGFVNSDDEQHVHWGKPSPNPLSNHSISQWTSDSHKNNNSETTEV